MAPKAAAGKKAGKGGAAGDEKREDVLQAVIIADSFQDRFLPFTLEKPRCLLPLANVPLIEYTLEYLAMNGVQDVFIYCGAHHEQIERYVHDSRWSTASRATPFAALEFIRVADARSIGDFLRDLDKRNIIGSDFILVHGDVVSNIPLDGALAAHRARREANRDSCMTMILRETSEEEHNTRPPSLTPVFVVDPTAKRCLHYEEMHPLQSDHYAILDPDFLKNPHIQIRTDLIDAQIDICTPDVLALWSESFDYELPRANFLHGVLKDYELNGKMIHTEIVTEGYKARASNLQMYDAISRDVIRGWTYPLSPESNFMKGQTYTHLHSRNVHVEDEVTIAADAEVEDCVVGRDTQIGQGSVVTNSVIGRNCKIGRNVRITDSYIWNDVTVEDDAIIEHAVIADMAKVGAKSQVGEDSLLSFGIQLGDNTILQPGTKIALLANNLEPVQTDTSLVGSSGKGAQFRDSEEDELDEEDPARLQTSLSLHLSRFDIETSSVSTLADDDLLSDDDSQAGFTQPTERSRLSSFASDDSGNPNFSAFHTDAVHGLLEALRNPNSDFSAEKLEFTSLRLANNASDSAMRRAVATAFVRHGTELMSAETGALDASRAAKSVLTSKKGASEFVAEVGVGGTDDVTEQIEFALAVQKACAASVKLHIDPAKAGSLLAALFQHMYDLDILEEEGIVGWWGDERSKEGDESMGVVREKCKVLVEWLENADEESSDEE
ncbi:eIF4-gamma/eIF5/eIF2-epsilon [Microdochium bolleyi]|uniref:Mannose-1-phosphate guanyltransferase n=1 Tax=Microdochium bolleyi TaxID=196109 RepID=A0A136IZE0_9PEZI|nr:eIF4-gamma/eIF5/eIF2-epsilon [Microdochium bolleyi]